MTSHLCARSRPAFLRVSAPGAPDEPGVGSVGWVGSAVKKGRTDFHPT